VQSLLAAWRLSLRRSRGDWAIVAAAWLITLLATTLFAAGPIYSSAAALAGLQRTLADAPVVDTRIEITTYGTPEYLTGIDDAVQDELRSALAPLPPNIVREGRAGVTLSFLAPSGAQEGDRAAIGFIDDLPNHAHLTAGAWPAAGASAAPLEVVLLESAANELQLSVGDGLSILPPQADAAAALHVRLVGIFAVDDETDEYWNADEQLTTGVVGNVGNRVIGPFLTTPEGILQATAITSVRLRWTAAPGFEALTIDNLGGVTGRLGGLSTRLPSAGSSHPVVVTGLPEILSTAERSLLVSRTQMLLLMAQLAVMAGYAILLTASLLVDHRGVETALLRSRGAGPGAIAWLALIEGLFIVVPVVLVAPWLAVLEATVLNVAGPLSDIGLQIKPNVTTDSYLLAGAAGLGCLVLLVLPAFMAARNLASANRELSRQETRPLAQRLGLDTALLVVSGIALWQLSLYGAPLTRTVQGTLGFDPLLAAAPALGLLAGGILALRILPLMASVLEIWIARGREVVASLGARQLARRPLRYTRTALLLMLAMALGVFALSYAETWSGSQRDQAAYQSGADVRAAIATRSERTPLVAADYAAVPGVEAAMPVERIPRGISPTTGSVDVLAVDAAAAPAIVLFRADQSARTLEQLMGALLEGRPAPALLTLPEGTTHLRFEATLAFWTEVPGAAESVSFVARVVARDASGHLYPFEESALGSPRGGRSVAEIIVPLRRSDSPAAANSAGALEIAALDIAVSRLPPDAFVTGIGLSSLSAGTAASGPWASLPTDGWAARATSVQGDVSAVPDSMVHGLVVEADGVSRSFLWAGETSGHVSFVDTDVATINVPVPVIVNPAFLEATGTLDGETISATVDGRSRRLLIAGVADTFPTTDPQRPLLVLDQATLDLMRLQATGETRKIDEWWLAVAPGMAAPVADALRGEPFDSATVVGAEERARFLSTDPVALGIIGALLLGFVATGVFSLVALVVSAAVSARERRTEFALLRALGLSAGQLSRWLWLENGSLVLASLVGGTAVGLVISWLALPFVTVTQQAATPVPSALVTVPWQRIIMLDLVVVIALTLAVAILAAVLRRIGVGSILRLGED
jgi:hypothetical protein